MRGGSGLSVQEKRFNAEGRAEALNAESRGGPRRKAGKSCPSVYSLGYARVMPTEPDTPRCMDCGYDLSGLHVDERCPECGLLVWNSAGQLVKGPWARATSALTWARVGMCLTISPLTIGLALLIHPAVTIPLCLLSGLAMAIAAWIRARRVRNALPDSRMPRAVLRRARQAEHIASAAMWIQATMLAAIIGVWWWFNVSLP